MAQVGYHRCGSVTWLRFRPTGTSPHLQLPEQPHGMTEYDAHQAARGLADRKTNCRKRYLSKPRTTASAKSRSRKTVVCCWMNQTCTPWKETATISRILPRKFADIMIGANYKKIHPELERNPVCRFNRPKGWPNAGAFIQASRLDHRHAERDRFPGRYDKADNFKGRFAGVTCSSKVAMKDNNIRSLLPDSLSLPQQPAAVHQPAGGEVHARSVADQVLPNRLIPRQPAVYIHGSAGFHPHLPISKAFNRRR